jgi:hypothetical protein
VDLELIPGSGKEGGLGLLSGHVRVDVHDEHGAVVAREDVQVVDVQLPDLAGQRCGEVV